MLNIRRSQDRGHFKNDWLDSYHTFSFSSFYDPDFVQYGPLRVINQDIVNESSGFGMHGHKDMEIFTYILSGTLEHQDSMGNKEQIKAGEVQIMSAGTGVMHSEYNPSKNAGVELLQIWVLPDQKNIKPRYAQKYFEPAEKLNQLRLVISPDESNGSLKIFQKTWVWASLLEKDKTVEYLIKHGSKTWLHVGYGKIQVDGETLVKGDAVAIESEKPIKIKGLEEKSDLVLIEV